VFWAQAVPRACFLPLKEDALGVQPCSHPAACRVLLCAQAAKTAGGPTRVEKAKIGLIQFHLSPPKADIENTVVISDYAQVGVGAWCGVLDSGGGKQGGWFTSRAHTHRASERLPSFTDV
jgi:hypothetical protein